MAQNFKHITSIISNAFTSSKCKDNSVSNFDAKVQKQRLEDYSIKI